MRRALGQQHGQAAGPFDQRHQHRGGAQGGARLGHVGGDLAVAADRRPHLGGFERVAGTAETAPAGLDEARDG